MRPDNFITHLAAGTLVRRAMAPKEVRAFARLLSRLGLPVQRGDNAVQAVMRLPVRERR